MIPSKNTPKSMGACISYTHKHGLSHSRAKDNPKILDFSSKFEWQAPCPSKGTWLPDARKRIHTQWRWGGLAD